MASHQNDYGNHSSVNLDKVEGLEAFKSNVEKHFFSKATIRDYATNSLSVKLVLELKCNFGLAEMLQHLKLGTWGNFDSEEHSFSSLLEDLKEKNDIYIEFTELSIFLNDTSIVILKIYDKSIPEQLEEIMKAVSENYVHFTKGLLEVPYEIFIPVFKECLLDEDSTLMNIKAENNNAKDYLKYWGLYFSSEEDVAIYDLKNTSIIAGDLQMLNW